MREIKLTVYGDVLRVNSEFDSFQLHHPVGTHKYCSGVFTLIPTSEEWMVLRCSRCSLRVLVIRRVRSYDDLEQYLKDKLIRA